MTAVDEPVFTIDRNGTDAKSKDQLIERLESGQVLHFADRSFELQDSERHYVTDRYAQPTTKNISYTVWADKIKGLPRETAG